MNPQFYTIPFKKNMKIIEIIRSLDRYRVNGLRDTVLLQAFYYYNPSPVTGWILVLSKIICKRKQVEIKQVVRNHIMHL
jgi:hypothetical protein